MGETQYWWVRTDLDDEHLLAPVADMRRIVEAAQRVGIDLAGADGEEGSTPTLTDEGVAFNGIDDGAHEPFAWPPDFESPFPDGNPMVEVDEDGFAFHFCKTGWKPYGDVVAACLLVAKRDLGAGVRVGSDEPPESWEPGAQLFRAALGQEPPAGWQDDWDLDG